MSDCSSSRKAAWEPITASVAPEWIQDTHKKYHWELFNISYIALIIDNTFDCLVVSKQ